MNFWASFACVVAATGASASALADPVSIGTKAPALDVKAWYKGTPVTSFEPHQLYVVEFWATWCGPCKVSIPHLTEMAKKYPNVKFVGVSIWEDDKGGNIKKFVDDMGAKMDYNVGYSGNQTGMAQSWMAAAGQNGIPTAFVVDDGKIDWIGHPMELDKPLEEITTGKYDLAASKAAFDEKIKAANEERAATKKLQADDVLYKNGSKAAAKADLEALVKKYPGLTMDATMIKLGWLVKDDPTAFHKEIKEDLASTDQAKKQTALMFAMRQTKPSGDPAIGKHIFASALADPKADFVTLYYASMYYKQLKENALALKTFDRLLVELPKSPYKDNKELAESIKKDREELVQNSANSKK